MATKVIGDYSAAGSIDGSTNYLLIQPGDSSTAYNKINRNVFLGVTGQPMDISTSQSVSNKTLGNTNTVTVKDTLFTLQDDGDTTKQAKFQLSGITTATTRTYTLPDASSTLADISTTQTFTNKTLTAPTINNGSITGTTITTDAIVGQSASTSGTVYGLSISSGKVGSSGVVTASITDGAVTPAKLQSGTGSSWAWQSYAVTWGVITSGTNTLGNGTLTGVYTQIGKTVFYRISLIWGSTTSSTGVDWKFSPPVTPSAGAAANFQTTGFGFAYDTGTANYPLAVRFFDSSSISMLAQNASGTYLVSTGVSNTVPFTFGNTDAITIEGFYEAA